MAEKKKTERRIALFERRRGEKDRRKYFDLTLPIEKEKRYALEDRRRNPTDRRAQELRERPTPDAT